MRIGYFRGSLTRKHRQATLDAGNAFLHGIVCNQLHWTLEQESVLGSDSLPRFEKFEINYKLNLLYDLSPMSS